MPDLNTITALIAAVAGLLTATSVLLGVLPKLGVHNAKLDALSADVASLAKGATTVAADMKASAPMPATMPPAPPAGQ